MNDLLHRTGLGRIIERRLRRFVQPQSSLQSHAASLSDSALEPVSIEITVHLHLAHPQGPRLSDVLLLSLSILLALRPSLPDMRRMQLLQRRYDQTLDVHIRIPLR